MVGRSVFKSNLNSRANPIEVLPEKLLFKVVYLFSFNICPILFTFPIQQRPTDQMYVGELYVDRDFEDGKLKGCSCRFNLGTKTAVEKYIQVTRENSIFRLNSFLVFPRDVFTFALKYIFLAAIHGNSDGGRSASSQNHTSCPGSSGKNLLYPWFVRKDRCYQKFRS